MSLGKKESNATSIVIFGASGDLTARKLVPALFNQYRKGRLPENFHIVGTARSEISHEQFREKMRRGVEELANFECPKQEWTDFSQRLWYLQAMVGGASLSKSRSAEIQKALSN
jgi:glucose-6-phosphate 1-dehydrogenase